MDGNSNTFESHNTDARDSAIYEYEREYGGFGMLREQVDPQELRTLYDKLDGARKNVKIALLASMAIAVTSILLGVVAILLPSILRIEDFSIGMGVLDYIFFGLLYLTLSPGIARYSRTCAIIAMAALAADVAACVYYGSPTAVFLLKAVMLFGLVQGLRGSIICKGLKKEYSDTSNREIREVIASYRPQKRIMRPLLIAAAACIGIGTGIYGVLDVDETGRGFGNDTYLSALIPARFLPTARQRIDSLDYLFEPVQVEAAGEKVVVIDGTDVKITYVAEYAVSGRVVGTHDYVSDEVFDLLSPRDVALAWGWLSDKDADSDIDWGNFVNRGFRVSVYYDKGDSAENAVGALKGYMSNNHLIPYDDEANRLINEIRKGHFVRIEGFLVNVHYVVGPAGKYLDWNTSTTRDNWDCEIVYVTNVTWLQGP